MKPASYWKKRFEALEQAQQRESAAYVQGELKKQFDHAMAQIEIELTAWYTKTAENNEISMAAAKRMLTASEQRELRWSLDEYRAKCKEYAAKYKLGTKDTRLLQQLKNVTARQAVTRLDALNLQLRMQLEDLYADHAGNLKAHLSDTYKESYYRTAYEIEKGIGVAGAFHQMDEQRAEMVLSKPWVQDGKTFSDRIWQDKNKLVNTLQKELPQQFTRGESLPRIVKTVAERMNVAQSSASRLVMTESAFFATAGERETMKALDVKQFEFVATLDDRTSEECRAMDGKHFPLKDLKVGENAPPLHCWCRSCIVPYFGDEKDGGRAARNPIKGKTEIVPADMTYPEWKSVYVDKEKTLDEWKNERGNGKIEVGEALYHFKKIVGEHSRSADLRAVNPHYSDGTPEYTDNCQRCAATYEARRRGYDVEAKPHITSETDEFQNLNVLQPEKAGVFSMYQHPVVDVISSNSGINCRKKVLAKMKEYGESSRATIVVVWKDERYGHAFVVEQQNGKTVFIDPQCNKANVEEYFTRAKREMYLVRTDNLKFSEKINDVCKEREVGNNDA